MIIGNFSYDPHRDSYSGSIRTLSFDRPNVHFRPIRKIGDKEPDYRVVEEGDGGLVELGAAWKRQSDKGKSFLSVLLDDPALGQSLHVALFDDREGNATLVWTRPRAKAAEIEPEVPGKAKRSPPVRAARFG